MPVKRRAPGQRLRRTRRVFEMEQLERTDPDKHAELVELRRLSPQLFRKELARLIKRGAIVKGRTYVLEESDRALLQSDDLDAIQRAVEAAIEEGTYGFRQLAGLKQEERMNGARPDLMDYLERRYNELLDAEGRTIA